MRNGLLAAIALLIFAGASSGASAYTFKTLYSFCAAGGNCPDGSEPGPLVMDAAGNLYGTTFAGARYNLGGTIYELVPNADKSAYSFVLLYKFCVVHGCPDGKMAQGDLVLGADGSLYGTTSQGGASLDKDFSGTAFRLTPNADRSHWDLTTLYDFCSRKRCRDGVTPQSGLTYAGAGTGTLYDGHAPLYGTTTLGGAGWKVTGLGSGTVFELVHDRDGQVVQHVIHSFCMETGCTDGSNPLGNVLVGGDGALYGSTVHGGHGINGAGTLYSLTHTTGRNWSHSVLYEFCLVSGCADGTAPRADLVSDTSGNLYGTAAGGGTSGFCPFQSGCGTVFKLASDNQLSTLYNFCMAASCPDGNGPFAAVLRAASGDIFATASGGGAYNGDANGGGTVLALDGAPQVVHAFCSEAACADGRALLGPVIMDASGNIFGAASGGGAHGQGVVFELTP